MRRKDNSKKSENKSDLIKEPYNPTDPEVKFDPELPSKFILKEYDNTDKPESGAKYTSLKDDGINIPVVRLNNITLNKNQIDQVIISYNDFLPKVHLSVKDSENVIKICDAPGFDNEINIVITCPIDGYYKKISLLFYITKFYVDGEFIGYDGIYKLQSLNTHVMKQIGTGKLNTYNMLSEIAKENKLGFAATEKCEDIKDERYRLIQSKTYVDYIKDQLSLSGLDEESIFDAWVDLFGYIVMVNVHYVMTENVEPEQLTIYTMYGGENTINDDSLNAKALEVQRTLTDNKTNVTNTNLQFEKYEKIIDNSNIYKNGALNTSWYMISPCEENKIESEQLQIIENSVDGANYSQEYEFSKSEFLGIEFSETPALFKTKINKRYFEKLRANRLRIELLRHNLGLERGTLVNIVFKDYNSTVSSKYNNDGDIKESMGGDINPFSLGLYYIDSMEFEYVTEDNKIKQYIYLIKKSIDDKPINKSETPLTNEK